MLRQSSRRQHQQVMGSGSCSAVPQPISLSVCDASSCAAGGGRGCYVRLWAAAYQLRTGRQQRSWCEVGACIALQSLGPAHKVGIFSTHAQPYAVVQR